MWLVVLLLVLVILWLILNPYFLRYDNLVSFTGGLGSGKTFMSVSTALVLYRKQRFRARLHNLLHPKSKIELPELYSNIPLKISRKKMALRLKKEHLLLQERIAQGSVVLLDEVDCFANQFSYNNVCIVDQTGKGDSEDTGNFDEFCRFYRHYTKGGYLIFNTQATANENLTIRRRQNQINMLFNFRKWGIPILWPNLLYTVRCRNITVSDEVKVTEESNAQDNMRLIVGLFPLLRHYDTYCYSGRYDSVPSGSDQRFPRLKTNECLIAPRGKQKKLTTNVDLPEPKNQENKNAD